MNWIRIFNILFDIINPNYQSHPNYFGGTRFINVIREIDQYFPTYSQFSDERRREGLSTSRRDYYYDILMSFDESKRIEIIKSIINMCDNIDIQKIEILKSEIGLSEINIAINEEPVSPNEDSDFGENNSNISNSEINDVELENNIERNSIFSSAIVRKRAWYRQPQYFVPIIVAFIAGVFGIIHVILPKVIDNSDSKEIRQPVIKMRVEPLIMSADSALYKKRNYLFFKIETSKGVYEIQDSFAATQFTIKDSSFFFQGISEPNIILREIRLDKFILDSRIPDIEGVFIFENKFILSGEKLANLKSKDEKEIAEFDLIFPYKFESKLYIDRVRIPIILKK